MGFGLFFPPSSFRQEEKDDGKPTQGPLESQMLGIVSCSDGT